jgi:hypothetical protein
MWMGADVKSASVVMAIIWVGLMAPVLLSFQNCSKVGFQATPDAGQNTGASVNARTYTEQISVAATKPNPPLDLFFIVDNSASMAGHQIDLGKNFATVFTSNSANLANFDTTIYIFSTASTVNPAFMQSLATRSPASLTSLPPLADISDLAATPGAIFGLWNAIQGLYGQVGYAAQFYPASVPGVDPTTNNVTPNLFMAHIGALAPADYAANVQNLTTQIDPALWTWAGSTLSLSSQVNLQIGDQLQYQYQILQR